MSTPEELASNPEETSQSNHEPESVSLVDLFDQMDRAAFQRSLEQRDITKRFDSSR